jgi:hypothetical protein
MTFPNPTLTWNMSPEYAVSEDGSGDPVSPHTIVEWMGKLKTAIVASTHWEWVAGGDGSSDDYLAIKPSSSDTECNKQRIVFASSDSGPPNTKWYSSMSSGDTDGHIIMNFCSDVTGADDDAAAYSAWESADVFEDAASTARGFFPVSPTRSTVTHFHLIESAESLCIVFSTGDYDATGAKNWPTWAGAIVHPLGPSAGDAADRVWGVSWAGSSAVMGTTSVTTTLSSGTKWPFGKSSYNYQATTSGISGGAHCYVMVNGSDWVSVWAGAIYSATHYLGTSTTNASNRDAAGNIMLSRVPMFRGLTDAGGASSSTSQCYGYLRQIYPWSNECYDREIIKKSASEELGYVVAPSAGTPYEGWAHLNI